MLINEKEEERAKVAQELEASKVHIKEETKRPRLFKHEFEVCDDGDEDDGDDDDVDVDNDDDVVGDWWW